MQEEFESEVFAANASIAIRPKPEKILSAPKPETTPSISPRQPFRLTVPIRIVAIFEIRIRRRNGLWRV